MSPPATGHPPPLRAVVRAPHIVLVFVAGLACVSIGPVRAASPSERVPIAPPRAGMPAPAHPAPGILSAVAPGDTASSAPLGSARRRLAGAFRADRVSHATLALAAGAGVGLASREPAAGAAAALALALAKEATDERFDAADLAAGAVGGALAWWLVSSLRR